VYSTWLLLVDYSSEWCDCDTAGHASSSEDEFKPESDKSDNEEDGDDDDEDDELSVVESTSGSSPEESEIETPEKVSFILPAWC